MKFFFKTTPWCFLATLIFLYVSVESSCAEIKIGVLANRGANRIIAQWGQTGAYLSDVLGDRLLLYQ